MSRVGHTTCPALRTRTEGAGVSPCSRPTVLEPASRTSSRTPRLVLADRPWWEQNRARATGLATLSTGTCSTATCRTRWGDQHDVLPDARPRSHPPGGRRALDAATREPVPDPGSSTAASRELRLRGGSTRGDDARASEAPRAAAPARPGWARGVGTHAVPVGSNNDGLRRGPARWRGGVDSSGVTIRAETGRRPVRAGAERHLTRDWGSYPRADAATRRTPDPPDPEPRRVMPPGASEPAHPASPRPPSGAGGLRGPHPAADRLAIGPSSRPWHPAVRAQIASERGLVAVQAWRTPTPGGGEVVGSARAGADPAPGTSSSSPRVPVGTPGRSVRARDDAPRWRPSAGDGLGRWVPRWPGRRRWTLVDLLFGSGDERPSSPRFAFPAAGLPMLGLSRPMHHVGAGASSR